MSESPPLPSSLAELEALAPGLIDPVRLPSLAYGIARRGELLAMGAVGIADKQTGRVATVSTPYSLASVTKPMTATAVALLVERGLLAWDDPINRYLGDARIRSRASDADAVTVRQVAAHVGGLPLHYQFYYSDELCPRPPFSVTAERYAKTFWEPGRYQYSNLGYGLLDHLIERLSGRSYAEFMRDEVFAPLGMIDSTIGAPDSRRAIPYGPDGVGYPPYDFDHPGGSAAYGSAEDLLTFGLFHLGYGPSLLPSTAIQAMQIPLADVAPGIGYGLGWGTNADRYGYRLVQHTGGMGGVATILRLVPDEGLVIAIAANGQTDQMGRFADLATAAMLPDFRERMNAASSPPAPEPQSSEIDGDWEGTVETWAGTWPLRLSVRSDHAFATLNGISSPVEGLALKNGRLTGTFTGDLGTDDTCRSPYRIHLDLGREGDRLFGATIAISSHESGGTPGKRMGSALSYWTDLRRQ